MTLRKTVVNRSPYKVTQHANQKGRGIVAVDRWPLYASPVTVSFHCLWRGGHYIQSFADPVVCDQLRENPAYGIFCENLLCYILLS